MEIEVQVKEHADGHLGSQQQIQGLNVSVSDVKAILKSSKMPCCLLPPCKQMMVAQKTHYVLSVFQKEKKKKSLNPDDDRK